MGPAHNTRCEYCGKTFDHPRGRNGHLGRCPERFRVEPARPVPLGGRAPVQPPGAVDWSAYAPVIVEMTLGGLVLEIHEQPLQPGFNPLVTESETVSGQLVLVCYRTGRFWITTGGEKNSLTELARQTLLERRVKAQAA